MTCCQCHRPVSAGHQMGSGSKLHALRIAGRDVERHESRGAPRPEKMQPDFEIEFVDEAELQRLTLAGANGAYGSKDTAQALLPNASGGPKR